MKPKPNTIISIDGKEFQCLECKGTFKIVIPIELKIFIAQGKAFDQLHKYCK